MTLHVIVRWPDPRLATVCASVNSITPETRRLAEDMLETMYAAPGRGLAAPQIGVMQRVFVMDATWKDGARTPQAFVNPRIKHLSETQVAMPEGCLSIPGVTATVARPDRVTLHWTDLEGMDQTADFDGFAAACVQHEIDHLDGTVILDKLGADERARVLRAYNEVQV